MADISTEIANFQNAVYGEEVRGSMISLAEKLNDVTEDCEDTVGTMEAGYDAAMEAAATATASANDAASRANSAASSAETAASSANTAAANATNKANAADALNTSVSAAETARVAAENARVAAERSRASAEANRVTAENARAGAESNRQSAELSRQEAETARNSAELGRVSAEATRAANETARQSAETSRVSAESNRVTEFTAMQRAFDDMSQQVLPPATYSTLGGVIIDQESGLEVDNTGLLSFTAGDFLTEAEAAATYATITTVAGKADASHVHSAVDITSGTLAVARGGTGVTTAAAERERLGLGSTTGALPIANGGTGASTASAALDALLESDPLTVANGGTGSDSLTANAILAGNGTAAVGEVATASGALYATASGGAASFGTLPIAQGGTGATTASDALDGLGALPLAGGTMTGDLQISKSTPSFIAKNTDIDSGGSAPSASVASNAIEVRDSNGVKIGFMPVTHFYNGNIGAGIAASRIVSDNEVVNVIRADVKEDGTKAYAVSDASAFRNAIGASSGIWPVAQGGSGQNDSGSITTASSCITINTTNATLVSAAICYWGKVAMLQFRWKNKNVLSIPADGGLTDVEVGTIASGYRPKGPGHGLSNGDEAGNATYYVSGTSGVISLTAVEGTGAARTIAANTEFSAFFCYVMS